MEDQHTPKRQSWCCRLFVCTMLRHYTYGAATLLISELLCGIKIGSVGKSREQSSAWLGTWSSLLPNQTSHTCLEHLWHHFLHKTTKSQHDRPEIMLFKFHSTPASLTGLIWVISTFSMSYISHINSRWTSWWHQKIDEQSFFSLRCMYGCMYIHCSAIECMPVSCFWTSGVS